jgi:hypothetical protein
MVCPVANVSGGAERSRRLAWIELVERWAETEKLGNMVTIGH